MLEMELEFYLSLRPNALCGIYTLPILDLQCRFLTSKVAFFSSFIEFLDGINYILRVSLAPGVAWQPLLALKTVYLEEWFGEERF
jgi:hypothetical protein